MANLTMKMLQEQINELKTEISTLKSNGVATVAKKNFGNLGIGDTFELAGLKWTILDITENGYMCLADRLKDSRQFDSTCNDWKSSDLRHFLNTEFYKKLADEIGEDNIITFDRDLLSMDGQTEYGTCEDKVSLLTVDEYRAHRKLILNADYWWWLIAPYSTKCNDDTTWDTVVSSSGRIGWRYCFNFHGGVRPVCILKSNIFVSKKGE